MKEIRCVTSTDNIEQERTEELPEVFGSSLLVLKNFSFIKRYDIMGVSNAYQKKEAPKPKSSRVTSERDKMRYLDR